MARKQTKAKATKPAPAVKAEQAKTIENTDAKENTGAKENTAPENQPRASDDDYDEDEDDDYDPTKKADDDDAPDSEPSDNEPEPDYSAINTGVSQVRTRNQRYRGDLEASQGHKNSGSLVEDTSSLDVDAVFRSMQQRSSDDWKSLVSEIGPETEAPAKETSLVEEKIRIVTTYTFAGKLVRESKIVDANSAEAKAYLTSTNGLMDAEADPASKKGSVTVVRKVAGTDEERPLRIKLKRPSLIDKFLAGDKKNKLTTLEKSRLDWASFVDKKSIKDDLALHNKGGYLEKQDFLGRMEAKRDEQYQHAREADRQRQWQQQQKTA